MNLTNQLVRTYLLKYSKKLISIRHDSIQLQKSQLKKVLNSSFSAYRGIKSETEFQQLTVSTYDNYFEKIKARLNGIDKPNPFSKVRYFTRSAGTTQSDSKYIPTSNSYLRNNHLSASWFALSILYSIRSDMDLFGMKSLLMGGAFYHDSASLKIADVSGIMIRSIPRIFHRYYVPTIEEALSPNWEEKFDKTVHRAASEPNIVMIGGMPTWIATLCKEVLRVTGKESMLDVWPNLKAFLHGGVKFEPYKCLFADLIPSDNITYLEVYNTSEGFFAVQDMMINCGLLLITNAGVYYEFVVLKDFVGGQYEIIDLSKVEVDVPYVLLISNTSGLYRYIIGDVIVFCSKDPFRIKITNRVDEYINSFGENLSLPIVIQALEKVLQVHNTSIREFFVSPKFISKNNLARHQWFIEFEKLPVEQEAFCSDLDDEIQNRNFEYRQKRFDNKAMEELEIIILEKVSLTNL